MVEVTEQVFWATIKQLNVHPQPVGKYPYTSVFKTPEGVEKGRIVNTGELHERESKYYLAEYSNG